MKKVLFGLFCLSFVAVMSCGGSSSGGVPTTESAIGATVLTSSVIGTGNVMSVNTDETCDGSTITIPSTNIDCGTGTGTVAVSGTMSCTTDNYKYNVTEKFSSDCTWDISTCSIGNTIITGTVTLALDASAQDYSGGSFSFTLKSDDLTLSYGTVSKKACPMDLTFTYNSNIDWTSETSIYEAFTGTICGADWTETQKTINDATNLEKLCAAL